MGKADYIRRIADAVPGNLDLAGLYSLSDGGKIARLATRSGVGIWTARCSRSSLWSGRTS